MAATSHRRRIALFLVAVAVPSALLVALGLRVISQERQLAERRLADERSRAVARLHDALVAELERIKAVEVREPPRGPRHRAVRLVAPSRQGRLTLPWESDPAVDASRTALVEPAFARQIQSGGRAEAAGDAEAAVKRYEDALASARHPAQAAYARLALGRALAALGRRREALAQHRVLLALPSSVTDEHGMPIALYAGARVINAPAERPRVLEVVRRVAHREVVSPAAAYLLRDLVAAFADSLTDPELRDSATVTATLIEARIRFLEQVLALGRDVGRLGLSDGGPDEAAAAEPRWVLYGAEPWLVSVAQPTASGAPTLIAVAADRLLPLVNRTVSPDDAVAPARLVTAEQAGAEALGPAVAGVHVVFSQDPVGAVDAQWRLQRSFYMGTLLLVLAVAALAGYLLWRDVRRETRLAEMRSHFVSSVSHELKTPLTAIRMFAETLQADRQPDPRVRVEYLETIVSETERLSRLLNNVLDFSKIERHEKTYRFEPTSLAEVVRRTARTMQYPFAQQGFELRLSVDDALPGLEADPDALEQAILNLLSNAMKYSDESRVVDLRLARRNSEAVIEVADRGIGIPPDDRARIVDKFYRVATPEHRGIPGTGLGLTIVDHIVRAHGGRLVLESVEGEGTTIAIHLPLGAAS